MKGSSSSAALLASAVLAASPSASAFAPPLVAGSRSATVLNLLPTQGAQLVAAWEAETARAAVTKATATSSLPKSDPNIVAESQPPLIEVSFETPTEAAAARIGLASRLFSLPSILRSGSAGAAAAVGHPEMMVDFPGISFGNSDEEREDDDVVLYPIVGFRWVMDRDGNGASVLPPMETGAACNLLPSQWTEEQEVCGWFSKACKLGSIHGPDEEYCGAPPSSLSN